MYEKKYTVGSGGVRPFGNTGGQPAWPTGEQPLDREAETSEFTDSGLLGLYGGGSVPRPVMRAWTADHGTRVGAMELWAELGSLQRFRHLLSSERI